MSWLLTLYSFVFPLSSIGRKDTKKRNPGAESCVEAGDKLKNPANFGLFCYHYVKLKGRQSIPCIFRYILR